MSPVRSSASWNVIEGALDEAITLLARSEPSPRTRAILVEARRLRSSIASWRAIPPRPATRKEVFDSAMHLLTQAGAAASAAPRQSTPPPSGSSSSVVSGYSSYPPPGVSSSVSSAPPGPAGSRCEVVGPGVTIHRPKAMEWRPFPLLEGVTLKILHREPTTGEVHALVRLAPGTELPQHRHAAVEDMYMLDGALDLGLTLLRSGEYCHASAGSVHERARTSSGCTFLFVGSERSEILV